MAIRNIRRQASPAQPPATPTAAPIYVDSSTNKVKIIPAGSGTTEVELVQASTPGGILTDSGATNRLVLNPTAKTIVDGSATALFSVAVPAGPAAVGGAAFFLVRASDGTEMQVDAGIFTYSAETKATVVVGTITYATASEAKAVSSGTLTLAFTADVSVANVVTYKLQPTGSLTETTPYTIEYTLFPIRGAVTIL